MRDGVWFVAGGCTWIMVGDDLVGAGEQVRVFLPITGGGIPASGMVEESLLVVMEGDSQVSRAYPLLLE